MKRIITVLAVMAVMAIMAAMVAVMTVPAFAAIKCSDSGTTRQCTGGDSFSQPGGINSGSVGGSGGSTSVTYSPTCCTFESRGGSGHNTRG
jgi:hypothetical protein